MNKELVNKMINHLTHLFSVADTDELMYGTSYVEFTDRGIRVIEPQNIVESKKNGK